MGGWPLDLKFMNKKKLNQSWLKYFMWQLSIYWAKSIFLVYSVVVTAGLETKVELLTSKKVCCPQRNTPHPKASNVVVKCFTNPNND